MSKITDVGAAYDKQFERVSDTYDVVLNALQTEHDKRMAMTMRNMNSENFGLGVMDDIRLEQCKQLEEAIEVWKAHNLKEKNR